MDDGLGGERRKAVISGEFLSEAAFDEVEWLADVIVTRISGVDRRICSLLTEGADSYRRGAQDEIFLSSLQHGPLLSLRRAFLWTASPPRKSPPSASRNTPPRELQA